MKKLLSIICTLAIVMGVVIVPGMVSVSAASMTELTVTTYNDKTTVLEGGGYSSTGTYNSWPNSAVITFDYQLEPGAKYYVTYDFMGHIRNYSKVFASVTSGTDSAVRAGNVSMLTSINNNKTSFKATGGWFYADDIIVGENKTFCMVLQNMGNAVAVKNVKIFKAEDDGYMHPVLLDGEQNAGIQIDSEGHPNYFSYSWMGQLTLRFNEQIDPNKNYVFTYEQNKSNASGTVYLFANELNVQADLSGDYLTKVKDLASRKTVSIAGSSNSTYNLKRIIFKGSDLVDETDTTPKYLNFLVNGNNSDHALYRNFQLVELDEMPFFTKFTGATNMYKVGEGEEAYVEYGIPANDTFGAGWGSDHYITSEYVLEPNSTYIITYDWKGHDYSEEVWFTIMNEAGTVYSQRMAVAHSSSKNAYMRQGSVLRTGSNVTDTHKYFGMMFKDYSSDPCLVKNVDIKKVDEAALSSLVPSYSWGNAFTGYNETDGAYIWEQGWKGRGAFTFDYVINPEDTYKISFHFKGANRLGDADNDANKFWALKTNTSTGKATYAAGTGVKIDTIPALDQQWGYYAYDFTFKGSDIGATAESPYLVLQQGGYLSTCYYRNIKIVNLSKTPADYSAVNAAIEEAGKFDKDNYTNFDAVENAIAAVVEGKMAIDQAVVDGYAEAINSALAALEYKDADYSEVNKAKDDAAALNKDLYKDFTAVDNAVGAVVEGKDITEQAAVDAMAKAINDAIAALKYKDANYAAVTAAIEAANALVKENYVSFDDVQAAIDAVDYTKNITEQDKVNEMAKAINDAVAALELKGADYGAVTDAIAKAKQYDAKLYTNYKAVEDAIAAVVNGLDITKQAQVDAYAKAILAAIDALEYAGADYGAVTDAIAKAGQYDAKLYANYADVEAAIKAVVYGLDITKQAQVDAYAEAILAAIDALEYAGADYSAVEEATAKAVALRPDADLYVNFQAVEDAVANVELGKNVTEQAEVDAMAKAINDALAALKYKAANYAKVEAAIAAANAVENKDLYANYANVEAAIKAVVYGLDITKQAEVDAYAKAINDAVAALGYKVADYSKVEAAIEAANALNKDNYVDFTAVDEAIAAVVPGLDITKQAEVDAMADAINEAIEALVDAKAQVNGKNFATFAEAFEAAEDGDTVTLLDNVTISNILVIDKSITLDGNEYKLTYTGAGSDARAINVSGAVDVTIKNLTIDAAKAERAINVIKGAANVVIDNVTATSANYTVNVAASAANAVVAIKNSDITGLNAVNVAAANSDITIDGTTITTVDNATTEGYSAICLNKDGKNGKIIATNTTVNLTGSAASDSKAARNGADGGYVSLNGSTDGVFVDVAYISYGNNYYGFGTLEAAIAKAKEGETIGLIRDVTVENSIVINKNIVLDGNNKTITVTGEGDYSADGVDAAILSDCGFTLKNITVVGGARGVYVNAWNKDIKANVVLENVVILNSCRAFNVTGGLGGNYKLIVTGGEFAGKISWSGYMNAEFNGVKFSENESAKGNVIDLRANATFTDCIFADGYELSASDLKGGEVIKVVNTTVNAPANYEWVDGVLTIKGANYEAVEAAKAAAEAINRDHYTADSLAKVDEAIAAVVPGLDITKQADVDAMAKAINDAIAALEYKSADYSAVEAAKAAAAEINADLYTNYAAVEAAIAAVDYTKNITEQADVDAMAKAINDAIAALEYKSADYSAVEAAKAVAAELNADLYTNYADVTAAIEAVVEGLDITKQADVDAMAKAINDAIAALEYKAADYSAVEAAIDAANAIENKDQYSNYADVTAAIAAVEYGLDITKQAEVDAFAKAINDAIAALELNGASYAAVNEAIAAANALNKANYVNFEVVQEAIDAVERGLDVTEQAKVDAYAEAILAAIDALVYADGIIKEDGNLYFIENGEKVAKGLVYVDGQYFYFGINYYALGEGRYYLHDNKFNGLTTPEGAELKSNFYEINADYNVVIKEPKEGIIKEDGKLYYYEDSKKVAKGLVYEDGKYYYFGINYYALEEGTYFLNEVKFNGITTPNGSALKSGFYTVNTDCEVQIADPKNGIVEEDGKLYYYEDSKKVAKGLVLEGGKYYYFGINYYALEAGRYWFNDAKLNGLEGPDGEALQAGFYTVDENHVVVL